jgi:hypothetical protein
MSEIARLVQQDLKSIFLADLSGLRLFGGGLAQLFLQARDCQLAPAFDVMAPD